MNRLYRSGLVVGALAVSLLLGCWLGSVVQGDKGSPHQEPNAAPVPITSGTAAKLDPDSQAFRDRLLEIAAEYGSYERKNAQYRWAPTACGPAYVGSPEQIEMGFSSGGNAGSHGRKLYSLFAKERPKGSWFSSAYVVENGPNPAGQVVVKESWVPKEVAYPGPSEQVTRTLKVRIEGKLVEKEDTFVPYAQKDGRLYHAKERADLFIMFKVNPQTPGTDQGWVYGTVTPDGKQVTSVGRVESCMGCHQRAKYDRLFGLGRASLDTPKEEDQPKEKTKPGFNF